MTKKHKAEIPLDALIRLNTKGGPEPLEIVSLEELRLLDEGDRLYDQIDAPFDGDSLDRIRRDKTSFREALVLLDEFDGKMIVSSSCQSVDSKAKVRAAMNQLLKKIDDELNLDSREKFQVVINMMLRVADHFEYKGLTTGAREGGALLQHHIEGSKLADAVTQQPAPSRFVHGAGDNFQINEWDHSIMKQTPSALLDVADSNDDVSIQAAERIERTKERLGKALDAEPDLNAQEKFIAVSMLLMDLADGLDFKLSPQVKAAIYFNNLAKR